MTGPYPHVSLCRIFGVVEDPLRRVAAPAKNQESNAFRRITLFLFHHEMLFPSSSWPMR